MMPPPNMRMVGGGRLYDAPPRHRNRNDALAQEAPKARFSAPIPKSISFDGRGAGKHLTLNSRLLRKANVGQPESVKIIYAGV